MAKITVVVPDELHTRMEEIREDWSGIVVKSLRKAVERHERILSASFDADIDDVDDVIARLRAERIEYEDAFRGGSSVRGKLAGFRWAKTASYEQLINLVERADAFGTTVSEEELLVALYSDDRNAEERFSDEEIRRDEWELIAGDDVDLALKSDDDYLLSFVEGVVEFSDSIEEYIEKPG